MSNQLYYVKPGPEIPIMFSADAPTIGGRQTGVNESDDSLRLALRVHLRVLFSVAAREVWTSLFMKDVLFEDRNEVNDASLKSLPGWNSAGEQGVLIMRILSAACGIGFVTYDLPTQNRKAGWRFTPLWAGFRYEAKRNLWDLHKLDSEKILRLLLDDQNLRPLLNRQISKSREIVKTSRGRFLLRKWIRKPMGMSHSELKEIGLQMGFTENETLNILSACCNLGAMSFSGASWGPELYGAVLAADNH